MEEQLEGTCRILETVVAPAVCEPYARTILDNLIANLRMVTDALPKVAGFLRDDNNATLSQLLTLREILPLEMTTRINAAAAVDEPDVCDGRAMEERSQALRALLAEAVCSPGLTPDMRIEVENCMISRASRAPLRFVPVVAPPDPSTAKR